MSPLAAYIADGSAFFAGAGLIIAGCGISIFGSAVRIVVRILAMLGVILVVVSSTPLSSEFYSVWFVLVVIWLIALSLKSRKKINVGLLLGAAVLALCLIALFTEIPYHRLPDLEKRLSGGRPNGIYVIGDSISSGIGEERATWPEMLREKHGIEVVNLSAPGATVASALRQTERLNATNVVVLIELGGNDLLGGTTTADFAEGLEAIIVRVKKPGRTLVMFELPLPPFRTDYGKIQRRLAKKYNVALIPKRVFAKVLSGKDATIDGLHLSGTGHEHMADEVWEIIGKVLSNESR